MRRGALLASLLLQFNGAVAECLHKCSSNGACLNGTCACSEGWTGKGQEINRDGSDCQYPVAAAAAWATGSGFTALAAVYSLNRARKLRDDRASIYTVHLIAAHAVICALASVYCLLAACEIKMYDGACLVQAPIYWWIAWALDRVLRQLVTALGGTHGVCAEAAWNHVRIFALPSCALLVLGSVSEALILAMPHKDYNAQDFCHGLTQILVASGFFLFTFAFYRAYRPIICQLQTKMLHDITRPSAESTVEADGAEDIDNPVMRLLRISTEVVWPVHKVSGPPQARRAQAQARRLQVALNAWVCQLVLLSVFWLFEGSVAVQGSKVISASVVRHWIGVGVITLIYCSVGAVLGYQYRTKAERTAATQSSAPEFQMHSDVNPDTSKQAGVHPAVTSDSLPLSRRLERQSM